MAERNGKSGIKVVGVDSKWQKSEKNAKNENIEYIQKYKLQMKANCNG